jgi:Fic family protein
MTFARVDELKNKLAAMRPLNETEIKRLREEFMIENTYHSNAIEGNTLTLRETALILQAGITIAEKPMRDHLEVIGHRDAFEYMISLADTGKPLSEDTIKILHSFVLADDAKNRGIYRSLPVIIAGAVHTPPQPYLVPVQMEALIAEYEDMKFGRHIIEAISEFHLRFEGIHPFIDGNGRTGRLILNFELIKAGFLPVNIKFSDRQKYYDSFTDYFSTNQKSDMLTGMIVEYEMFELMRYINMLEQEG